MAKLKESLWLNRYMLSLFGVKDLKALSENLKDSRLEGYNEQNRSRLHEELVAKLYASELISAEQLRQYDENIYRHTQTISKNRGEVITWKYFQYLALLFTEVYLDKYFHNAEGLLKELNSSKSLFFEDPSVSDAKNGNVADLFGETVVTPVKKTKKGMTGKAAFELDDFRLDNEKNDLNKLAFWNATGSGKTLLMHVNILQYQQYVEKMGRQKELNRIIVLTPNEGLSRQHLAEFKLSGLEAEMFSKATSGNLLSFKQIEIIDIHKLGEKSGEKTIAFEAFEGNNLVLVDEGHRGSSGETWMRYRSALSQKGFSFEYSATFGQAVNAQTGDAQKRLLNEYGKSVLFDYSYKYFYEDGYGKDYQILNLNDEREDARQVYLTACLLQFYEQTRYFEDNRRDVKVFNIEKPLAIFVGGTVNAVRTEKGDKVSDVVFVLQFLDRFVKNKNGESVIFIERVLNSNDALVDKSGSSILANKIQYLKETKDTSATLFTDMLLKVFHSPTTSTLFLDNLKGQDGEIGLRLGTNDYFGVINVGDDRELLKLCDANGLMTSERDFADSLFRHINTEGSKVNVLIGSKKFTEGWSSWRVSTMGLMNVGKGEGSEIIQLFGRGVRLKGYNWSLRRSTAMKNEIPSALLQKAKHLPLIETLNVFGLKAAYMEQFKQYLEEEGVPKNDGTDNFTKITLPIMPTFDWNGGRELKYLKIKDGVNFKKARTVVLASEPVFPSKVQLDWYARVQRIGKEQKTVLDTTKPQILRGSHLAFLDWDKIWLTIQRFKSERGWHNLMFSKATLQAALQIPADNSSRMTTWYELQISEDDLALTDFRKVQDWQEIATRLLQGYCEKSYNFARQDFLKDKMETAILTPSHDNFFDEYQLQIQNDQTDLIHKINALKQELEDKTFNGKRLLVKHSFEALFSEHHLYQPLMYMDSKAFKDIVQLQPVALNEGEKRFVEDLKRYYTSNPAYFSDKEMYLLRNKSRTGVTFFDANGGFSPDFILWLFIGDKQHICFIDPKGLHHIGSLDNDKIRLHQKLKNDIEPKLGDSSVFLHSFLVSVTEYTSLKWRGDLTMPDFNEKHVYFQKDQQDLYVGEMLKKIT
jgi:hypothetical protein